MQARIEGKTLNEIENLLLKILKNKNKEDVSIEKEIHLFLVRGKAIINLGRYDPQRKIFYTDETFRRWLKLRGEN